MEVHIGTVIMVVLPCIGIHSYAQLHFAVAARPPEWAAQVGCAGTRTKVYLGCVWAADGPWWPGDLKEWLQGPAQA